MESTSVRIDRSTHEELERLAHEMELTVGETMALAVRGLRQELVGNELRADLTTEEATWLNAELG